MFLDSFQMGTYRMSRVPSPRHALPLSRSCSAGWRSGCLSQVFNSRTRAIQREEATTSPAANQVGGLGPGPESLVLCLGLGAWSSIL